MEGGCAEVYTCVYNMPSLNIYAFMFHKNTHVFPDSKPLNVHLHAEVGVCVCMCECVCNGLCSEVRAY